MTLKQTVQENPTAAASLRLKGNHKIFWGKKIKAQIWKEAFSVWKTGEIYGIKFSSFTTLILSRPNSAKSVSNQQLSWVMTGKCRVFLLKAMQCCFVVARGPWGLGCFISALILCLPSCLDCGDRCLHVTMWGARGPSAPCLELSNNITRDGGRIGS